jgi:HJR/Mrr/RecB family endonuclease
MGIFKHQGSAKAQKARDVGLKLYATGRVPAEEGGGDPVASGPEESEDQVMLTPEVEEAGTQAPAPAAERSGSKVPPRDTSKLPKGWKLIEEGEWSLELLGAMDWKLFEVLSAELFRKLGNEVEMASSRIDGGIDFVVKPGDVDVAVKCLQRVPEIDLKRVRDFCGTAVGAGSDQMVFITSGEFDDDVRQAYKEDRSVQLIDGKALLRNINKLGEEVSGELLQLVVGDSGGWQTPSCVACGIKMELREAKELGKRFWGCANFEKSGCYQTIDLP